MHRGSKLPAKASIAVVTAYTSGCSKYQLVTVHVEHLLSAVAKRASGTNN